MVHCCCVPECSNRSNRESHLSFFSLPLKNRKLLRRWVHLIGRKQLPLNRHTRVCSKHFVGAEGRRLYPDEVPSLFLPKINETSNKSKRKPPRDRSFMDLDVSLVGEDAAEAQKNVSTQTSSIQVEDNESAMLRYRIAVLEKELEETRVKGMFRLANIKDDDTKINFYTGFMTVLKAFYDFLGPSVDHLKYSKRQETTDSQSGIENKRLRPRSLAPIEEFFMTLVRLRLGLIEQDIAYRFGVSQFTVSRITCTWINFMFLKLKELPLWPPKELIKANMPQQFKKNYPTTRVIVDATEIYIEQPHLPEIQQMTFSNYKNDNTFKALVGISPDGVITFISALFPGSISDKALTRQSGLLDLLQPGDSVMADRGFDIEDDLMLRGVHLNIPPFLRGKTQLSEKELISTRRIATLRIHVERAMERIKNFHIFDKSIPVSLTDIADRIFYICCVLTNFQKPLV